MISIVTHALPGDGVLIPRWSGGNDVAAESGDGLTNELPTKRIMVARLASTITPELTLSDVSARVLITDSRVVVACRRFEPKGGGWWGFGWGAAIALVANAVSKARAAARGSGKAAVGHIRYDWVNFVGWRSKTAGSTADDVRIGFRLPGDAETLLVDLRIPSDLDPALIALEVIRRAARHRLAHGHAHSSAARQRCLEMADAPLLPPNPTGFALYQLPAVETATSTPRQPSNPTQRPRTPQWPCVRVLVGAGGSGSGGAG